MPTDKPNHMQDPHDSKILSNGVKIVKYGATWCVVDPDGYAISDGYHCIKSDGKTLIAKHAGNTYRLTRDDGYWWHKREEFIDKDRFYTNTDTDESVSDNSPFDQSHKHETSFMQLLWIIFPPLCTYALTGNIYHTLLSLMLLPIAFLFE